MTADDTEPPEVKPARQSLIAFAAESRNPQWAAELDKAITKATTAGWPVIVIEAHACHLILRKGSDPKELEDAIVKLHGPHSTQPRPVCPPAGDEFRASRAAWARQAMAAKLAAVGDMPESTEPKGRPA